MSKVTDLIRDGLRPVVAEGHGFSIQVRQIGTDTYETVTVYHGTGDQLGALDHKQERNFAGLLDGALTFDPAQGDEVIDEHGQHGEVVKARRTNHGTWELQVWRAEERT